MPEIIVEATGLPLRFPDPQEEARARAVEFRRLSPEGRWREIVALMGWGLNAVRSSPRRADIEKRWQSQEEEWQRLQHELMVEHAR